MHFLMERREAITPESREQIKIATFLHPRHPPEASGSLGCRFESLPLFFYMLNDTDPESGR